MAYTTDSDKQWLCKGQTSCKAGGPLRGQLGRCASEGGARGSCIASSGEPVDFPLWGRGIWATEAGVGRPGRVMDLRRMGGVRRRLARAQLLMRYPAAGSGWDCSCVSAPDS